MGSGHAKGVRLRMLMSSTSTATRPKTFRRGQVLMFNLRSRTMRRAGARRHLASTAAGRRRQAMAEPKGSCIDY